MINYDKATLAKEQQRRFGNILGFVASTEVKYPKLAKDVPGLLMKVLGGQTFSPELMVQKAGNVAVGVAVLGDFLKETGFGGFDVKLGMMDSVKKVGAKTLVSLPNRDTLFRTSGIGQENWGDLQNILVDFSKKIQESLDVGYQPKQIVAGLFIQSTAAHGQEQLGQTSETMRSLIEKVSGGQLQKVNQVLNSWIQGK